MKFLRFNSRNALFFLCAALSFLSASCAQSTVSQCRQIIEVTMNIANETRTLSDNGNTKAPQDALQVADAFEEAAQTMRTINLQDQQLTEYQEGFATMYLGMSEATRNFIAALNQKDVEAARSAKERLQKLGSTERELVSGINRYCQE